MVTALWVIGRVCLALIFILSGVHKIKSFQETVDLTAVQGVPYPSLAVGLAVACMLLGGLSLATGVCLKWGVVALLLFVVVATYYFHRDLSQPEQMIHLLKNIAICGGLCVVLAHAGSIQ